MGVFASLATVVGVAALAGMLAKRLGQPTMLGYLLAGVVISVFGKVDLSLAGTLGQLGVTLLLFLVGLELPVEQLRRIGKTALLTGTGQIVLTTLLGAGLASLMGFAIQSAWLLGMCLTFGSTVVVINILAQKRDLYSLYGRIATGFLLVQDLVALGILVVLSGLGQGGALNWGGLVGVMGKAAVLLMAMLVLARYIFPLWLRFLGTSSEVLFVGSLAWCLVVAAIVSSPWVGFGPEMGGFLAGLALASAAQNWQIAARISPLRDFFMTLFFVFLGAGLKIGHLVDLIAPAIIFSVFVLVGNPLLAMLILQLQGYKKRVAFLASLTVAQVSEFSLLIMGISYRLGLVSEYTLAVLGLVVIITMTLSTYLLTQADSVFTHLKNWLPEVNRGHSRGEARRKHALGSSTGHIILFGHNRMGSALLPVLRKLAPTVVVDFDPEVVTRLQYQEQEITAVYGDAADAELHETVNLSQARLVISTIADIDDNLQLLSSLPVKNRPIVVVCAQDRADAGVLYQAGADYVLIPQAMGGEYLANLLERHGLDGEWFSSSGRKLQAKLTG